MKHWWVRNNDLILGDYTKDEVEDFTGCIPLILESCIVNRKINLQADIIYSIYEEICSFIEEIRIANNEHHLNRYITLPKF